MTNSKFICKLLKLKGLKVSSFSFNGRGKELHLYVKPFKNGCCCPECNRRGKIKRSMPNVRLWRDVCVCGLPPPVKVGSTSTPFERST